MQSTSEAPVTGTIESIGAAADERLLYDRKEAARQLSISVRSLDYLIGGGQLETRRIGKKVLIPHGSLTRFSQANHYDSPKDVGRPVVAVLSDLCYSEVRLTAIRKRASHEERSEDRKGSLRAPDG
jgi:hypothetical protein